MCACGRSSWPGRAGRPPGRILVRLTFPSAAVAFCFARPPSGWGCPSLLVRLHTVAFFLCACGWAPVVSLVLWFLAPAVPGLGADAPSPSLPWFFLIGFFPSCLSLWPAWFGVCFHWPSFSSFPPFFLFPSRLLGLVSVSCRPLFPLPPPPLSLFFPSWFSLPSALFGACFRWPSLPLVPPPSPGACVPP